MSRIPDAAHKRRCFRPVFYRMRHGLGNRTLLSQVFFEE